MNIKLSDVLATEKFHEELTEEPLKMQDILEMDILIIDISNSMTFNKSKYQTDNKLILFTTKERLQEKKDPVLCWISGEVVISQLDNLKKQLRFPLKSNSLLETKLTKPDRYFKFE